MFASTELLSMLQYLTKLLNLSKVKYLIGTFPTYLNFISQKDPWYSPIDDSDDTDNQVADQNYKYSSIEEEESDR